MVATIVIAVATTACSRPTVGVVDDSLIWGSWSGRDTVVQLGTGQLTVKVGAPTETIADADPTASDREAEEGWTFVPVLLAYSDREGVSIHAPLDPTVDPADLTSVAAVVAGESLALPFPTDVFVDMYLHVEASTVDSIAFEISFDGVTQRITAGGVVDRGDAEGLYGGWRHTTAPCGGSAKADEHGGWDGMSHLCQALVWESAWLKGLGWAPDHDQGATWGVIQAQRWLPADLVRHRGRTCEVPQLTAGGGILVDGREPIRKYAAEPWILPGGVGTNQKGAYLLSSAPEHELEITSTWRCDFGDRVKDRTFVDRVLTAPAEPAP